MRGEINGTVVSLVRTKTRIMRFFAQLMDRKHNCIGQHVHFSTPDSLGLRVQ